MKKLFVYINKDSKTIENIVQELPDNWKTIHGLNFLESEKLEDLSWAGYENCGWVQLGKFNFSGYSYTEDFFNISKNGIKQIVTNERKLVQNELLTWNGKTIIGDEKTKTSLVFKSITSQQNPSERYLWKFENGYYEIGNSDLIEIIDFINSYQQSCFDIEELKHEEIDLCETISDLSEIDLSISWPSMTI